MTATSIWWILEVHWWWQLSLLELPFLPLRLCWFLEHHASPQRLQQHLKHFPSCTSAETFLLFTLIPISFRMSSGCPHIPSATTKLVLKHLFANPDCMASSAWVSYQDSLLTREDALRLHTGHWLDTCKTIDKSLVIPSWKILQGNLAEKLKAQWKCKDAQQKPKKEPSKGPLEAPIHAGDHCMSYSHLSMEGSMCPQDNRWYKASVL